MRLGTGAARDGLYGFINSSQCGTLDVRCNAGSTPAHACGGNVYILYLRNKKKQTIRNLNTQTPTVAEKV